MIANEQETEERKPMDLKNRIREIRGKLKSRTGQLSVRDFNFLEFLQYTKFRNEVYGVH